jgi:hypothetical protein
MRASPPPSLVRLHTKTGGVKIEFAGEHFASVSPDIFVNLDRHDPGIIYRITRKFNLTIGINPDKWSAEDFFRYFTRGKDHDGKLADPFTTGALRSEAKCAIHGDKESRLYPSPALINFLGEGNLDKVLTLDKVTYTFDSVGVAANRHFAAVDHREDNPFASTGSHFELKFRRISAAAADQPTEEYLCLNIHLTQNQLGNKAGVTKRFKKAIRLFSAELGIRKPDRYVPATRLAKSLSVHLENYDTQGFSYRHPLSEAALARYLSAPKPALPRAAAAPAAPTATHLATASAKAKPLAGAGAGASAGVGTSTNAWSRKLIIAAPPPPPSVVFARAAAPGLTPDDFPALRK